MNDIPASRMSNAKRQNLSSKRLLQIGFLCLLVGALLTATDTSTLLGGFLFISVGTLLWVFDAKDTKRQRLSPKHLTQLGLLALLIGVIDFLSGHNTLGYTAGISSIAFLWAFVNYRLDKKEAPLQKDQNDGHR
jgi:hypothetical protein